MTSFVNFLIKKVYHTFYKSFSQTSTYLLTMVQFLQKYVINGIILMFVNFPFLDGYVPRRPSYGVFVYLNLFALPEQCY